MIAGMPETSWSRMILRLEIGAAGAAQQLDSARARVIALEARLEKAHREGGPEAAWRQALDRARSVRDVQEQIVLRRRARLSEARHIAALTAASHEALRESYRILSSTDGADPYRQPPAGAGPRHGAE